MTTPPATVAEFEQLLGKAKSGRAAADHDQWQGRRHRVSRCRICRWTTRRHAQTVAGLELRQARSEHRHAGDGAGRDHAAAVGEGGYLPTDVNTIDQTPAPTQFLAGKGVFFPSGNWQAPGLDKGGAGKFGFFLFPAAKRVVRSTR